MKKIFYSLLVVALVAGSACKKDTVKAPSNAFEDITFQDIKDLYDETGFTFQEIIIANQQGYVLKPGSVILYKLVSTNRLGKLKILSISPEDLLTFDMTNYDGTTGAVVLDKKDATVAISWIFNLDTGLQDPDFSKADFYWNLTISDLRVFTPFTNTRVYVYSK